MCINKNICFFVFCFFFFSIDLFSCIKIKFPKKFSISSREISIPIIPKLPPKESEIVNSFNGFYGLIGPDINMNSVTSLYDLFTGDGNIQGIFLENGNITFIKQFIRTEKLNYEEENGKIPTNFFFDILFTILHKIKLTPNMMGLANTALLKVNKKIYALFERDMPYLIDINFKTKKIDTISKINIRNINTFSAHSKFDNDIIKTIDYDIIDNSVRYYTLNENFDIIQKIKIKTNYIPLIHDFLVTENKIILVDSPLKYDKMQLFIKKIPILFDKTKKTVIHILSKTSNDHISYTCNDSFYLFHYADYKENETHIEIYAPLYDDLNFMKLDIKGNYRKMVIDKITKSVEIVKREELEKYNLDFPIPFDDKIILRNINGKTVNGFVICKELDIVKELLFEKKHICGEPVVIYQNNIPYLLFFSFEDKLNGHINLMNLRTFTNIEITIPNIVMNIGFHSIYIKNKQ